MIAKKWWHYLILLIIVGGLTIAALAAMAVTLIYPTLPNLETITDYHPKQPLRIYSADGFLITEFGEERRDFIRISKIPQNLKDAVLAIEDRRFYQHGGVDTKGILRAIKNNVTGKSHEGASTITMQVAKNFFTGPNRKRNIITKIKEALLAIKIEKTLNKDKILELYLNQIYLGQRAYGFQAASQVYFGKSLTELTLAESALLAGLPKAPSGYNPFTKTKKAINRQHEVLRDMRRYGFINDETFKLAMDQTLEFKSARRAQGMDADYVAELARQILYRRYGDDIYTSGLKVYTTILKKNQEAANKAVNDGIINYQLRRGFKKQESFVDLSTLDQSNIETEMLNKLKSIKTYQGFSPAIVTKVSAKVVSVFTKDGVLEQIKGKGLRLLARNLKLKNAKKHKIKPGSVVRIIKLKDGWTIMQLPQVQSALVALDPKTGAIKALVGGFDFNKNKYNHVTQAKRQAGSSFKPFVYSAALEKGFTPASIIEDEPITMITQENGRLKEWTPKNYDGKFEGPMRLRTGLIKSKNIVSIRILDQIGPRYAQDYITKFGFSPKNHPPYLTMALGAGETTPLGLANAYAVFANGGYRVEPHIISKITDSNGKLIQQKEYPTVGKNAPRVIDKRNVFIMTSLMRDVVQRGTATRAKALGRKDVAGKTGTTNDLKGAWFAGYSPHEVAISWVGYDKPRSLGRAETGGRTALPIWVSYMATSLKGKPDLLPVVPQGVMAIKIDPITGTLAYDYEEGVIEYFYQENPPPFLEADIFSDQIDSEFPPDNLPYSPLQPQPPGLGDQQLEPSNIRVLPRDDSSEVNVTPLKYNDVATPLPMPTPPAPPQGNSVKKTIKTLPKNKLPSPKAIKTPQKKRKKEKTGTERAVNILNPAGY